jgi:ribosome maturation protein SDO1
MFSYSRLYQLVFNESQILNKGEVQVGEKEREHDLSSLRKEIATLVAEKCVDPDTQKPYPVGMIEKAMGEAGYSVRQGKNAKSQVAECIKLLQSDSKLPIQRARMRIRVTMPKVDGGRLKEQVLGGAEQVEKDEVQGEQWEVVSVFFLQTSFSCLDSMLNFLLPMLDHVN